MLNYSEQHISVGQILKNWQTYWQERGEREEAETVEGQDRYLVFLPNISTKNTASVFLSTAYWLGALTTAISPEKFRNVPKTVTAVFGTFFGKG